MNIIMIINLQWNLETSDKFVEFEHTYRKTDDDINGSEQQISTYSNLFRPFVDNTQYSGSFIRWTRQTQVQFIDTVFDNQ